MTTAYIAIYLPFLALFIILYLRKKAIIKHIKAKKSREKGEALKVEKLAEKYMDKKVWVKTIDDNQYGFVKSYDDGFLTIADKKGKETHINAEYIVSITLYGKEK